MKTIQDKFDEMMAGAYPDGCDPWQRRDMRNAFFGGVLVGLNTVQAGMDSRDMSQLNAWDAELDVFLAEITLGVRRN